MSTKEMLKFYAVSLIVTISYCEMNSSIEYIGPADVNYFEKALESVNINNLTSLECNVRYSGRTTVTNPVEYYILDLTEEIKSQNPAGIGISTCCNPSNNNMHYFATYYYSWYKWYDSHKIALGIEDESKENFKEIFTKSYDDWMSYCGFYEVWGDFFVDELITSNASWKDIEYFYDGYSCGQSEYCDEDRSLDTFLYLISEKKNRYTLIDVIDDNYAAGIDSCNNSQKSIVDLSVYYPNRYVVGVGGFYNESGPYQIELYCKNKYSFPIKADEIEINNDTNIVELNCGSLIQNQVNNENKLVSYYKFTLTSDMYAPIIITTCNGEYNDSSRDDSFNYYDSYLYLATEQDLYNNIGNNYMILNESDESMICQDDGNRPADIILTDLSKYKRNNAYFILVQGWGNDFKFDNFSISMSCGNKPSEISLRVATSITFGSLTFGAFIFSIWYIYRFIQHKREKESKKEQSVEQNSPGVDVDETIDNDLVELTEKTQHSRNLEASVFPFSEMDIFRSNTTIRRIGKNENINALSAIDCEDKIQRLFGHVLQCCEEESALDVYQVLAVRYIDPGSREITVRYPLRAFGINTEIISISPFYSSLFLAVVTGLLQTMGISVVVFKLLGAYFVDSYNILDQCSMDKERWNEVYSLKILAFLWSLVITFSVSSALRGIKHDGFYKVVSSFKINEGSIFNECVSFNIIRCGQIINYYACLLSVIGSFFIIFETNDGSDYSHSGLDMVLNAVALFFMLELDDIMVQYDDFRDIENILQKYDKHYEEEIKGKSLAKKKLSKKYKISIFTKLISKVTNVIAFCVISCLYVVGVLAPFFIFLCY